MEPRVCQLPFIKVHRTVAADLHVRQAFKPRTWPRPVACPIRRYRVPPLIRSLTSPCIGRQARTARLGQTAHDIGGRAADRFPIGGQSPRPHGATRSRSERGVCRGRSANRKSSLGAGRLAPVSSSLLSLSLPPSLPPSLTFWG